MSRISHAVRVFFLKPMYFHQSLILTFQSGGIYIYVPPDCQEWIRASIYIYTRLKDDIDHLRIVHGKLCFDTFLYFRTTIASTAKHSKLSPVNF